MSGDAGTLLSLLFALIGIACLAVWPLLRTRGGMLAVQLLGIASLSLHYQLGGVATAAAVNALGAAQIAASMLFATRPGLRWIGYALPPVVVGAALLTWQGMPSLLAAIGTVFITLGRAQADAARMRLLVVAGGPFWLAHDLLIWSPVALADAVSLVTGLTGLALHRGRTTPQQASNSRIAAGAGWRRSKLHRLQGGSLKIDGHPLQVGMTNSSLASPGNMAAKNLLKMGRLPEIGSVPIRGSSAAISKGNSQQTIV